MLLVHLLLGRTGLNCASSKDNVADEVDAGTRMPSIDKLAMIGPLLLNQEFGNIAAC